MRSLACLLCWKQYVHARVHKFIWYLRLKNVLRQTLVYWKSCVNSTKCLIYKEMKTSKRLIKITLCWQLEARLIFKLCSQHWTNFLVENINLISWTNVTLWVNFEVFFVFFCFLRSSCLNFSWKIFLNFFFAFWVSKQKRNITKVIKLFFSSAHT